MALFSQPAVLCSTFEYGKYRLLDRENPEVYAYMKTYTPYENVEGKRYPPILAETSLNDTRVLYVEPAKWVAKLRSTAANRDDFLLKTEMSAGHGGVSGRYNAWRDRAFSYAWILDDEDVMARSSPSADRLVVTAARDNPPARPPRRAGRGRHRRCS